MIKVLSRILIITLVFVLLSGLMVVIVNAAGWNAPDFRGNNRTEFQPPNGGESQPSFPPQRARDGLGVRWISGMIKNIGVIAILVIAIVWPKSVLRKRRRAGM